MQFVHSFANAASGGDSGNGKIAHNKKHKSVLKNRSTVMKGEPDEISASTGNMVDIGASNVVHRDVSGGTDLASNQTEGQRLESALKDLTKKIAALKTSEAEVELPVLRAGDHDLDNPNTAQYHPKYTEALLEAPKRHVPFNRFMHDPHHYIIDFIEQDEKSLLKLNGGRWFEKAFPEDDPSSEAFIEPENYFSPFPGQSSVMGLTDLHVHSATHTTSITFTLPQINLTHTEFVEEFRPSPRGGTDKDGTVKISVPAAYLKGILKEELKDIDWEHTPYHINVFDIVVTEESSNFLVDFDKVLTSVSAEKPGMLNSWSTPRGVDSTAHNLVAGPSTPDEDKKRYFNKILADGASNIKRNDAQAADHLYIAPSFKNGAEHPRWINRNWQDLAAQLTKMTAGNAYQVKLPPPSKYKDFDFIVLSNMKEISRRTRESGEQPNHKRDGKTCEFNKIYSTDATDTSAFTLISKKVLDNMFKEKKKRFDQEKQLMRLEELVLVLWPVQGKQGWDAYAEIANDNKKVLAKSVERVKFSCEITISYEPYRQALCSTGSATSFGMDESASSSSSSSSSSKPRTFDAIKNEFSSLIN